MPRTKTAFWVNLMLVGDLEAGLSKLAKQWCPDMAPLDGYSVYHSNCSIKFDIQPNQPPYATELMPAQAQKFCVCPQKDSSHTKVSDGTCPKCKKRHSPSDIKVVSETVEIFISIISPSQISENPHLTPIFLGYTDLVALCYTIGNRSSLENAVHKWYPIVRYHCDRVPIILLGVDPKLAWETDDIQLDEFDSRYSEELRRVVQEIDPVQHVEYMMPDDDPDSTASTDEDAAITRVSFAELGEILAWHGYHCTMEKWLERRRRGCVVL